MGGNLGVAMNANSGNYNYFSGFGKVSFDGFINENYFQIETLEKNLIENLEITHAITKNPINCKKDRFLGLFLKSKFDDIGYRQPIDLSIALDISGSMTTVDQPLKDAEDKGKTRIELAKESLVKLISIMDPKNDKLSLTTFDQKSYKIFELSNKEEIENKHLKTIGEIKAYGGTDLIEALKGAIENFNEESLGGSKMKRIIMITDAWYGDSNNKLLKLFEKTVNEKNISITIMAISNES